MRLDCVAAAHGVFLQGSEFLSGAVLDPTCTAPNTSDMAMARILGADLRVVAGPNGELLLPGHAGWAILWNERRDRPK